MLLRRGEMAAQAAGIKDNSTGGWLSGLPLLSLLAPCELMDVARVEGFFTKPQAGEAYPEVHQADSDETEHHSFFSGCSHPGVCCHGSGAQRVQWGVPG